MKDKNARVSVSDDLTRNKMSRQYNTQTASARASSRVTRQGGELGVASILSTDSQQPCATRKQPMRQSKEYSGMTPKERNLVSRPPKRKTPKHPLNSYMLFAKEERVKMRRSNPDISGNKIQRELGRRWSQLSIKLKQKYVDLANQDRERFQQEWNAWAEQGIRNLCLEEGKEINERHYGYMTRKRCGQTINPPASCSACNHDNNHNNNKDTNDMTSCVTDAGLISDESTWPSLENNAASFITNDTSPKRSPSIGSNDSDNNIMCSFNSSGASETGASNENSNEATAMTSPEAEMETTGGSDQADNGGGGGLKKTAAGSVLGYDPNLGLQEGTDVAAENWDSTSPGTNSPPGGQRQEIKNKAEAIFGGIIPSSFTYDPSAEQIETTSIPNWCEYRVGYHEPLNNNNGTTEQHRDEEREEATTCNAELALQEEEAPIGKQMSVTAMETNEVQETCSELAREATRIQETM